MNKFLLTFFIASVLVFVPVYSTCLDQATLDIILNETNSTELINTLELLCSQIKEAQYKINETNYTLNYDISLLEDKSTVAENERNLLNLSLSNHTSSLVKDITEVNGSSYSGLGNLSETVDNLDYYNKTEGEKLEARINYNLSKKIDTLQIQELEGNLSDELSKRKVELEDVFDTKVSSLKKKFITLDDFENMTAYLKRDVHNIIEYRINPVDRLYFYLFLISALAVVVIIIVYKYAPELAKHKGLKVRPETHTIEELTTKSDLKKRIVRVRDLKLKAVKIKLKKDAKVILLKKIDNDEITNEDELNQEIEILKGLR